MEFEKIEKLLKDMEAERRALQQHGYRLQALYEAVALLLRDKLPD
jgi:hypothetical protein